MKKIAILMIMFSVGLLCMADDDRQPVEVAKLPHLALSSLKQYFPDVNVVDAYTSTKKVKDEYTVKLANSVKIVFDKHGQWKEIEANNGEIPQRMIHGKIQMYMSQHNIQARVVEMNKDKKGNYEVELSDDTELFFDNQFNPIMKKD